VAVLRALQVSDALSVHGTFLLNDALSVRTEQERIVAHVERLLARVDAARPALVKAAKLLGCELVPKKTGAITQAILGKAFRGELVPTEAELARREGRSYEPASVLLDRIRAERAAGPAPQQRPARRRKP
jgi:hypothetical protein